MVDIRPLVIDASRLWPGEEAWEGPLAFIELDPRSTAQDHIRLPPCPVIGMGDPSHPLAAKLDAVIEPPVRAEAIARQVTEAPLAAATVVQVLRMLETMPPEAGLDAESFAYAMLQGSAEHRRWMATRPPIDGAERSPGRVRVERRDERLVITLDHAGSGNIVDRAMRDQLFQAFALAGLDPRLRRISLRAAGRTFSLGADLAEFGTTLDPATAHAIRCRTLPARQALHCASKLDVHVQGACVGAGLELAAWAQRFTAAPKAWFQLPELAMGILPGAGGCVSLTRRMGRQRTALMVLSGKRISVRTALEWGLVDVVVDDQA